MIGLCRGLARQATKEIYGVSDHIGTGQWFFRISRKQAMSEPDQWPARVRYYQLLDACGLRMRPEPEWLEIPEFLRMRP